MQAAWKLSSWELRFRSSSNYNLAQQMTNLPCKGSKRLFSFRASLDLFLEPSSSSPPLLPPAAGSVGILLAPRTQGTWLWDCPHRSLGVSNAHWIALYLPKPTSLQSVARYRPPQVPSPAGAAAFWSPTGVDQTSLGEAQGRVIFHCWSFADEGHGVRILQQFPRYWFPLSFTFSSLHAML